VSAARVRSPKQRVTALHHTTGLHWHAKARRREHAVMVRTPCEHEKKQSPMKRENGFKRGVKSIDTNNKEKSKGQTKATGHV